MRTPSTLLSAHGSDAPVAVGAGGTRTAHDLLCDAHAVALALAAPPADDAHAVMVFKHDRYAFAAGMLGAWSAGYAVALPPNTRRDTVVALLDRPDAAVVLHDTRVGLGVRVSDLLGTSDTPIALPTWPSGQHLATVYTSGSTGQATPWSKTAGQLLGEAAALASLLGLAACGEVRFAPSTQLLDHGSARRRLAQDGQTPGRGAHVRAEQRGGFPTKVEKPQTLLNPEAAPFVVLPTVGPTHIYGLLFGVLFPLASGGAFVRETPLLPETIAAQVRAHDVRLLVTVPAHLRAFEALSPKALAPLRHVVSSTAPLSDAIVDMMRTRHDLRITEVLGSTETGGIASRDRAVDPAWQALPGVTLAVDADARLLVTSPYVDQALPQPYRTQDTAELLSDGRIAHRGRADDIVKIGGRRVSLRAMETALLRHPDVTDAAVLAIADDTARSTRLVAIVSIGASTAVDGAALRGTLLGQFEPSTVPRKIHIRRALPREANGKLQRSPALRMVGLGPDGRPRVFEPVWLDATAAPCAHVFRVQLPENYAWFDGHFATYPVMAGAVQIEVLVLPCVRRARPTLGRITQLSKVKFLGRIGPGDTVTLTLTWSSETPEDEGPWVDFRMTVGETGKTVTDGRAVFAAGTQCEASPG